MKKQISKTLVFTIIASNINTLAFATGKEVIVDETNQEIVEDSINKVDNSKGTLEVDINFDIPIKYSNMEKTNMSVILTNKETNEEKEYKLGFDNLSGENYDLIALGGDRKRVISSENEDVNFYKLTINNIDKGDYTVSVKGDGYIDIEKDITINKTSKRLSFGTSNNEIVIDENQSIIYPGSFLAGDIDENKIVDINDYELLKSKIKSNSNDLKYDLNRDGKLDITDLSYIHVNLDVNPEDIIIEDTNPIIDSSLISLDNENLIVNGNIETLFNSTTTNSTVSFSNEQEVSEENPLEIGFSLGEEPILMETISIDLPNNENAPTEGVVVIDGKEYPFKNEGVSTYSREVTNNSVKIDLGQQVAVSQITIKVTGTRGNTNLTEIAKVEFINNAYKEIPKPKMNIPVINYFTSKTLTGKEELTIGWEHESNVEAYEIKLEQLDSNGNVINIQKFKTSQNRLTVPKVEAYATYRISIQSLNGEWQSGYKDQQDDYDKTSSGDSNLTNNSNDKDGKPDNVDENYKNVGWDYTTGILETNNSMFGADSIIEVQIVPENKPDKTDKIKVEGLNKGLKVTWGSNSQAREYDIYYREVGEKAWLKANDKNEPKYVDSNVENDIPDNVANIDIENISQEDLNEKIKGNSITIPNLKDNTTYEVKVVATNHHGSGVLSETYIGTTVSLTNPEIPNYKLINTPKKVVKEGESPVNGIVDIIYPANSIVNTTDKFAIVDGDYNTNWTSNTWNIGYGDGKVNSNNQVAQYTPPLVIFDKEYEIGSIRIASRYDAEYDGDGAYDYVPITYWDSESNSWVKVKASFKQIVDDNKVSHFEIVLPEKIKTDKIQVALRVNCWYEPNSSISEIKFYEYDGITQEVNKIFKDDLQLELNENVTQEQIDDLRIRVSKKDIVSGEYHPNKTQILETLKRAEDLLNDKALNDNIKTLDVKISSLWSWTNTLGQTNDWQSLGVAVRPGDKINVYIAGDRTDTEFELGITQNYAESDSAITVYSQKLKVGKNEIVIPETGFDINSEKGGNLFIRFGNNKFSSSSKFKVRTSGAIEIPHLNLNDLINNASKEEECKKLIREYIKELKEYTNNLPNMYSDVTDVKNNIYPYDEKTSILNTTEIEGDKVTLSLPATQILKGLLEGIEDDEDAQVDRLYNTLLAWEQLMEISFSQQGLISSAIDFDNDNKITDIKLDILDGLSEKEYYEKNKIPSNRRLNIKYQRMFPGAFMYASGHHIGVGFETAKELVQGVPYKFNEEGEITNADEANLFGWGISHEIGHVHDINGLTYQETTNNILALITQTFDDISKSRIEGNYDKVYDRVTSHGEFTPQGTVGLAMFWQLHLAYDDDNTYNMLSLNSDNNPENDTFFAKLYRETRLKGIADSEIGYDRTAQTFIMRASDAVKKDLREFFSRWGITASPKTNEYLDSMGYEKEDKAIFYLNDEARRKRLECSDLTELDMSKETVVSGNFTDDIEDNSYINKKEVTFEFDVNQDDDKILGYELIRKEITSTGQFKETAVGFVERDKNKEKTSYTDIVDTANNRVYEYKVVAYDYNLNKTEEFVIGTVKVKHDGSLAKNNFSFYTNTRGIDDEINEDTGHGQVEDGSINNVKDNNKETVYNATKVPSCHGHNHAEDAYITIDLGNNRQIIGLKYTAPTEQVEGISPITEYDVFVSEDNKNWQKAHTGVFEEGENTIYFNESGTSENNQLWAYNARYVKIVSKNQDSLSIAELDVLAPPGDNIEIGLDQDEDGVYENGVGILEEDYTNGEVSIPQGSLVVMGEFRGNPAYNVPLILNENGENFAIESQIILLADIPENSQLDEIAKGTYIYWVTPEQINKQVELEEGSFVNNLEGSKLKAVLYRYNKLVEGSPVGQRLVSDSMYYELPSSIDDLPKINLTNSQNKLMLNQDVFQLNEDIIK